MKNELAKIEGDVELLHAIKTLGQPDTDYVIDKFIVNKHETDEMRYAHCVLNIRLKYDKLRRAKIVLEKMNYQIETWKKKAKEDKMYEFKWREKEIDKEGTEAAVIGALRELSVLYSIYKSFDKKYTREEINALQPEYWSKRLEQQAYDDAMAHGRIGVGNLQALRHIGKGVKPELDYARDIEEKYLEGRNPNDESNTVNLLIGVATEDKPENGTLPCLNNLVMPEGVKYRRYNCYGRSTADAYNDIAMRAIHGMEGEFGSADYLLIVEDDTFPPPDAIIKLFEHIRQGKKAVGAWYRKRQEIRVGAPIVKLNGKREALDSDGETHEVYTLPMGCTLYDMEVFYKTQFPYFVRTEHLSQDSFFSQKLRDAGYKLYCDTSIRCKHIDRETSVVYE